jgi:diguanylate cyclase (GGDEF)-like protein
MIIPFTLYSLWLFGVALLLFWVTIIVWQRSGVAHEPLGLTLSAGAWWALLYGLELTAFDAPTKLFWFCFKYIGITTIAPWCVLFILEYTRSPLHRDKRVIFALTWLSLATLIVIWTNDWHHLFFRSVSLVEIDGVTMVQTEKGPFYWSHVLLTYGLFLFSALHFLRHIRNSGTNLREQSLLVFALVVPWSANILHQFNFDPFPGLDLGPFALAISGLSITWVLFDMRLMDLVPVNASIIFEAVSDGMILLDPHHKILAMNPTARRMLGNSVEYAIGQPLTRIIPGATRFAFNATTDPNERLEFGWGDKFFELRQLQLTFRFRQSTGQLLVLTDVTHRKQSELEREGLIQQLQASLAQSRALYRSSKAVIGLEDLPTQLQAVTDEIFVVLGVSQAIMVLTDWNSREISLLVQARPQDYSPILFYDDLLLHPLIEQAYATAQLTVREASTVPLEDESILAVAPLRYRSEKMGVLILYDNNRTRMLSQQEVQALMAMAGHAAIAISNSRLFEEVHQLATTDGLTGLYNRRHFLSLAEQAFQFAKQQRHPFAVMLLDVDLFKQINDKHGHTTGDEVLRDIATLLKGALRDDDIVGRYGGEEFAITLPQTTLTEALEVAEELRHRVATTIFPTAKGPVTTTISLGVAELRTEFPSFLALLDRADNALYKAKSEGRNRVVPMAAAGQ